MPANKRNEKQKAIGQASFKKAQERKALINAQQEDNRKINEPFREDKERTPYQERKREKFLARVAEKYGSEVPSGT